MDYQNSFNPYGLFQGLFIPEGIARSRELAHAAKLIYGRLLRYAGKDGRCFPSVGVLADEVGIDSRQARRCLADLEEIKLIRRVPRHRDDGGNRSNLIEFLWHPLLDGAAISDRPPCQEDPEGVSDPPGHEESHIRESYKNKQQQQQQNAAPPGIPLTSAEWPLTTRTVTGKFPTADAGFLVRLVEASVQTALSLDVPADAITDERLARIVLEAIKANPNGRLPVLLKNVTTIIENWVKQNERQTVKR